MKCPWERAVWVGLLALSFVACAACGGGDDNGPPPTVTKYYAYVANYGTNTVSGYSIDATTGAWTAVPGSPFATNARSTPISVAADPTGKYAYLVGLMNQNSGYVSAYTIDPASGRLTAIAGSPFLVGNCWCIAFDPEGRFVYLAEYPSQVRAFDIRLSQGALTSEISVFGIGGEGSNFSIIADASGLNRLYVANTEIGVYGYNIDATTGALTLIPGSPFPGASYPSALAMDLQSKFLYAATLSKNVAAFSVNKASGQLTAITGSPFPAGTYPWSVAVDPTGKFAYVANQDSDEVIAYTINASTGALTYVSSYFSLGSSPWSVAVEPTGKFAYVADFGADAVSAYSINSTTGALTQTSGSPFSLGAGSAPAAIAIVKITQ
jgi:6-phosphogluconolactonase